MHKYRQPSKTSLFLMELIISIFFLAITSVVCIRLYLNAHQISEHSTQETQAVQLAQNAAESFLAANGDLQQCLALYLQTVPASAQGKQQTSGVIGSVSSTGSVVLSYDRDWSLLGITAGEAPDADAAFLMTLTASEDAPNSAGGHLAHLAIDVQDADGQGQSIYSTNVEQYVPADSNNGN